MLFNPNWNKPSIAGFIVWLETKDSNEAYDWCDINACACAQYFKMLGGSAPGWGSKCWEQLNEIARGNSEAVYPRDEGWTFGRCLERAKAAFKDKRK